MANNTKMGLTRRQKEYLEWIKEYLATHDGEAPSYEEIATAMETGISSAQRIVSAIIERGHLANIKGSPRSLALVE